MKPIRFSCQETMGLAGEEIARQMLDVANWSDFEGYGVLPGIRSAQFEVRTPEVVGSRVRVTCTDGSNYIEQIVEWQPEKRLKLHFQEFSPPLSRLATGFDETWEFHRQGDVTLVTRSFELYARSAMTRPAVWLMSLLLKRAIARQLRQMRDGA
jgi:hypothetical protein